MILLREVIFYTTGCPKCKILKKKLDEKDVVYAVNDSVDEMLRLGITQVPMLSIDGQLKNFKESIEWVNNYKGEIE